MFKINKKYIVINPFLDFKFGDIIEPILIKFDTLFQFSRIVDLIVNGKIIKNLNMSEIVLDELVVLIDEETINPLIEKLQAEVNDKQDLISLYSSALSTHKI